MNVPEPITPIEQYLHGILLRTDALCEMMSSLLEHIAKKEGIATENVVEEVKKPTPRKKKVSE